MRVDITGASYFLTTTTQDRKPIFTNDKNIILLKNIITSGCKITNTVLYAYAIMPDHYHILVKLGQGISVAKLLHSINSYFSNQYRKGKMDVWQDRPWDEVIRSEYMFYQKMSYILLNPWRKGIVKSPMDITDRTNIKNLIEIHGEEHILDLYEKHHGDGEV